jgi:hypothetical protein
LEVEVQRVLVRELGGRLRISGAGPELRLLFDATRLSSVLELVDAAGLPDAEPWLAPEDRMPGAAA